MIIEGYFLSVLHKNILNCGYSLESPWQESAYVCLALADSNICFYGEINKIIPYIRDFNGHLPYPFQNPISNFYLSLEAGKSSTDSVILRKLTNVEIIFRAWTKSLKRTKLYFDD